MSLTTPPNGSEAAGGVARQSEGIARATGSTRCTTRCIEPTCWHTPTDCCRANGGAAGVDGQTFEDIEAYGLERWLGELAEELRNEDVSSAGGSAGVDSQARRQAAAVGDSDGQRPRGADGGGAGLGADLRGRPAAGAVRLPAGAQRPGRRTAGPLVW